MSNGKTKLISLTMPNSKTESINSLLLGPLNFIMDIVVGALVILKPFFSIAFALFIIWTSLGFVSNKFSNDLSTIFCAMPFSSYISICQTPIPDFSRFINRQAETYEQIMDQQLSHDGASSTLALDIKKTELASADLRTLVKYSNLVSAHELVNRLTEFIEKSRIVGRNLQILQSRTKSSLDNLITYNLFALKSLENVRDSKVSRKSLSDRYNQMMNLIEVDIKRMIIVGQEALGSLTDLDEMLLSIHEIITQESILQKHELGNLLAELWTFLGGNNLKKQIYQENLGLLYNLDGQRKKAVSQVQTTLYTLTSFQFDLEELREQVITPSLIEMPIEVHIENVNKGVERLRNSKLALKSEDGGRSIGSGIVNSNIKNSE